MSLWPQLRALSGYLILMAIVYTAVRYTPSCTMVKVSHGYQDMANIGADERIRVDRALPFAELRRGDLIAVYVPASGGSQPGDTAFARIAGLPGDRVAIREGTVLVNDTQPGRDMSAPRNTIDHPDIIVPHDHLFVISSRHRYDSFAFGPLPSRAVIGRIWRDR